MPHKKTLSVTQLDLDVSNPRFNSEGNQTDAMRSLLSVERNGEKVLNLAMDICKTGMLDPGDRLYVMKSNHEPNRHIVLDGNRRLTALRLLSQPALIDRDDIGLDVAMRQRFKRLQTDFKGKWPNEVDVVVFEDKETANHFIRLRHTGENDGAGRSAWSALQVARFDHTGSWQCLEYLRQVGVFELDVINALDRSSFEITNFERVVEKTEFQKRFGFTLGAKKFEIGEKKQRALKSLAKVASDVVSGRVHSRDEFAKAENMSGYFNEVEASVPQEQEPSPQPPPNSSEPTTSKDKQPESGNTGEPPSSQQATKPPTSPATPYVRKQRTPKYLIDKKDLLTVTNPKCRAIVSELKEGIVVNEAPYACALLLRSLQEMTAEIYAEKMQLKSSNITANIDQAVNNLLGNPHLTDPVDKTALLKSFKSSAHIYDQLCETAHNANYSVSPEHVRNTWASLRGGMDLLWKRIHSASPKD